MTTSWSRRLSSKGLTPADWSLPFTAKKLRGQFVLIRMQRGGHGKPNWLLIKLKDAFARPEPAADPRAKADCSTRRVASSARRNSFGTLSSQHNIVVAHPDKILYPDPQVTKADVFAYYQRIAPHLLPYLRDRPVTLERMPDGIGPDKPRFWQKDTPAQYPDWIPRIALSTQGGKVDHYALVNNLDTLLYLVNQGTLTFHIWLSHVQDLDHPDVVLFDLDPGRATFKDVVSVAGQLHAILNAKDTPAFVKTSGKTGVHVLVPWRADHKPHDCTWRRCPPARQGG